LPLAKALRSFHCSSHRSIPASGIFGTRLAMSTVARIRRSWIAGQDTRNRVTAEPIGKCRTVQHAGDADHRFDPVSVRPNPEIVVPQQSLQREAGVRAGAVTDQNDRIIRRPVCNKGPATCFRSPRDCWLAGEISTLKAFADARAARCRLPSRVSRCGRVSNN
jgi:hypothetical protein